MITRIGINPHTRGISGVKKNSSPTFCRDFNEAEKSGVIKGDPMILAKTCALVEKGEITHADGALETVYEMTRRNRSNIWVDALRKAVENVSRKV